MFTINEIKQQYTKEKRIQDRNTNFWVYMFNRKLSFYPTWLFIRLGMTANQVTFFSILIGLIGCLFFSLGGKVNFITGAILINIWAILDCVDGNMARLLKSASSYGWFLDSITGLLLNAIMLSSIGVGLYHQQDSFIQILSFRLGSVNPQILSIMLLVLGCIGSLSAIFYALIIHLFRSIFRRDLFKSDNKKNKSPKLLSRLLFIGRYLTGFGFIEPILLVASVFNYISIILVLFSLVNFAAATYVSITAVTAAKKISMAQDNKSEEVNIVI